VGPIIIIIIIILWGEGEQMEKIIAKKDTIDFTNQK